MLIKPLIPLTIVQILFGVRVISWNTLEEKLVAQSELSRRCGRRKEDNARGTWPMHSHDAVPRWNSCYFYPRPLYLIYYSGPQLIELWLLCAGWMCASETRT